MTVLRSITLFAAALFELGGAWLVWRGVREHKGWAWIGAGVIVLGVYGFVAVLLFGDPLPAWLRALLAVVALVVLSVGLVICVGGSGGSGGNIGDGGYGPGGRGL